MDPVHVIGDADTVLAFAVGGVPGSVVETADEARAAVEAVVGEIRHDGGPSRPPALLLITQGTAKGIRQYLDRVILDTKGPLVVEIPGASEPRGQSPVGRFVERILGVRL